MCQQIPLTFNAIPLKYVRDFANCDEIKTQKIGTRSAPTRGPMAENLRQHFALASSNTLASFASSPMAHERTTNCRRSIKAQVIYLSPWAKSSRPRHKLPENKRYVINLAIGDSQTQGHRTPIRIAVRRVKDFKPKLKNNRC